MTIELQDDFSRRKARSLGRLCSYTLLFGVPASCADNAAAAPFGDSQRTVWR